MKKSIPIILIILVFLSIFIFVILNEKTEERENKEIEDKEIIIEEVIKDNENNYDEDKKEEIFDDETNEGKVCVNDLECGEGFSCWIAYDPCGGTQSFQGTPEDPGTCRKNIVCTNEVGDDPV